MPEGSLVMINDNQNQEINLNAYEMNGQGLSMAEFTRHACDPRHSVVVQACAGSGKTWLLVARMLRLLLEGVQPAELLAITFTRKAAQEMRQRLLELLHELALANEEQAKQILLDRGIVSEQLTVYLPRARNLYESILAGTQSLSLDTFHSWFGRLIQLAPLASGVPHGFSLLEGTAELQREAYRQLMQTIQRSEDESLKTDLLFLFKEIGDAQTKSLLDVFLNKRAEWWAANHFPSDGKPISWLTELLGEDAHTDARLSLWHNTALVERISMMAQCLGKGTKTNQERAVKIEAALSEGPSLEHFQRLTWEFFDDEAKPRSNRKTKDLKVAIDAMMGGELAFDDEWLALIEELSNLVARSQESTVLAINRALFNLGQAYINCYQDLKGEQRVFDFSDLEWQAYSLLNHPEYAAYLQARLDARYKHILLDEFQDTNMLQWQIVLAWLNAYEHDVQKPTVFIVGDAKQSIYRFRRAEPRVFVAATQYLCEQGAYLLQTNQTRRNAREIVAAVNQSMFGNRIYHSQTTTVAQLGQVWRLPLLINEIQTENDVDQEYANGEDKTQSKFQLRNPFISADLEQEDVKRYQEGVQVAQALWQAKRLREAELGEKLSWSEVMLLVRRRTHLSAYEKALREAQIPFVSSRRGGLLDVLEVSDFIALLNFLMTPSDNRALAHVLKSPMIAASDHDLICLAQRSETTWWKRLLAHVEEQQANSNLALEYAAQFLQVILPLSHTLTVHDLLDTIMHKGNMLARYAQYSNAAERSQVIANLQSFIELSLNMDAGRFPSLPKFIAALNAYQQHAQDDAPDESSVVQGSDAVSILTIHSAKGLEADIVVMLDSNHSMATADHIGILYHWPLSGKNSDDEKKHFSAYGKKSQRGRARDHLFIQEEQQAQQENLNLLYVAATRAKNMLIVSGVESDSSAAEMGVHPNSWYVRFMEIPEYLCFQQEKTQQDTQEKQFNLTWFQAPTLPVISPLSNSQMRSSPDVDEHVDGHIDAHFIENSNVTPSQEQLEGIAFHTLMERLTNAASSNQIWPIKVPSSEKISSWLPCSLSMANVVGKQAQQVLQAENLRQFFDVQQFEFARNELDLSYEGVWYRLDRIVVYQDEVWVLDYKRQLLACEKDAYQLQLHQYASAIRKIFPEKTIRTALILANAEMVEFKT
jgi:ATP-dependent helicase/nuclease subunit A